MNTYRELGIPEELHKHEDKDPKEAAPPVWRPSLSSRRYHHPLDNLKPPLSLGLNCHYLPQTVDGGEVGGGEQGDAAVIRIMPPL